jgi:hypothetical protein
MSNANNLFTYCTNACLKASLCIVFLVISPPAFADDSKSLFGITLPKSDKKNSLFEGAYIGLGLNYEANLIKKNEYIAEFPIAGVPLIEGSNNGNIYYGVSASLHGGYNFVINPKFLLGVGGEFSISDSTKSIETDLYLTSTSPATFLGTEKHDIILKNRYNFHISPGYVISKDKLVYTKLGYSYLESISEFSDDSHIEPSFHGYQAGLGYKQVFKDNLYGFGEINYYYYPFPSTYTYRIDAANYSSIISGYDSLIITFGFGYLL